MRLRADIDPTKYPIEGYAQAAEERGVDSRFSCDAITEVADNLWTGGCLPGVDLPEDFKYVVSLYPWGKWGLPDGCERVEWEMFDSAEQALDAVDERAEFVNECRAKGKTLVHCQAGLNRSGLVTARALMLGPEKLSGEEAIALLREKRTPLVLCNEQFEKHILGLDHA